MPVSDILELGLKELNLKELSLDEVLDHLQAGEVVVVKSYEETRGVDVLVRFDRRKYVVTQISFDVEPVAYGARHWEYHAVAINALSLNRVYLYEEAKYFLKNGYTPGSIVYIEDAEKPRQIAVVDSVFYDLDNRVYYTLDNLEGLYFTEAELFANPLV